MEKNVLGMEQPPHVLNWQLQTISLDRVLYLATLLKPAFNYVDVETLFHFWVRVLVKWLWEELHIQKVVGSNLSTVN